VEAQAEERAEAEAAVLEEEAAGDRVGAVEAGPVVAEG
jgi:hypothetical protein